MSLTPDGTTVVGIMQSPLDNPTTTIGRASATNRIVTFNVATGATREHVYTGAIDVTDPANSAGGKMFGGKVLEALSAAERQAAGIVPVTKSLVYDLLTIPGRYPHDKFEGLALSRDGRTLFVANDDDFGVIDNGAGGMMNKILPMTQKQDRLAMTVWYR